MNIKQARIWYLHHSGFAVETDKNYFIFDYSQDEPAEGDRSLNNGVVSLKDLDEDKSIFVFVSHAHADHFNRVIFEWQYERPDIRYILSDDVHLDGKYRNCCFLSPYRELTVDAVKIRAFGSTDVGVSFLVEADGISIFHAGDLNCWYWYYESTEDELKQDKQNFEKEVERIKGQKVDIAFFPVDPRLKEYFHMGGEYFIKTIKPKLFVPMHFWDQYRVTREFADKVEDPQTKIVPLSHRGQQIIYKE
ncbi:MAG: MBL fold metallo-hydrolase [Clostridiales bacterium]|jgi:L-ascorbate metabolism protein UlaG (beta-lactamase superfamily)|nr:MBL fold metallo-hydrolase [Clostridiales bacterium]